MSKEYLEALKIGIPKLKKLYENSAKKMSQNDILGFDLVFVYLDKALQRLEAIDNANPSEALECLEYIENKLKDLEYIAKQNNNEYLLSKYIPSEKFSTIKQSLLKAQEQEKVLNIIKEKRIDIETLKYRLRDKTDDVYLHYKYDFIMTREEFDLLKRWLG